MPPARKKKMGLPAIVQRLLQVRRRNVKTRLLRATSKRWTPKSGTYGYGRVLQAETTVVHQRWKLDVTRTAVGLEDFGNTQNDEVGEQHALQQQ